MHRLPSFEGGFTWSRALAAYSGDSEWVAVMYDGGGVSEVRCPAGKHSKVHISKHKKDESPLEARATRTSNDFFNHCFISSL